MFLLYAAKAADDGLEEKKMIDRKTVPSFSIWFKKDREFLNRLEKAHVELVGEKEHDEKPQYVLGDEIGTLNTEEYYFAEDDCSLFYNGSIGEDVYVSFEIPLSDEVLIDILAHSVKRLNKLKTALETLK